MSKLKHALIIILAIIMSLLLCTATPPPEKTENSFTISMDIPAEHKIKIINYGLGSVFIEDTQKNSGDIVTCKRFSSLTFTIIPNDNYQIDTIVFNNKDITYNLAANKIILQNITEDGTLTINFKQKPSPAIPDLPGDTTFSSDFNSYIDTISSVKDFSFTIYNKALKMTTDFSDSVATGDNNIYIILSILLLSAFYIAYKVSKSLKK